MVDERHFEIEVTAPFRLDLTVEVLRRRAHNLVDRWDGHCYRRTLIFDARPIEVEVRQRVEEPIPILSITLRGPGVLREGDLEARARQVLDRMLGLSVDLSGFYDLAERDERLSGLAAKFRGMRPTRYPTVFETVVNAVACQQLSLSVGVHLLNRLAGRYGTGLSGADESSGFPAPAQLAVADLAELRALGFSNAKARVLVDTARRETSGELDLESLVTLDDDSASRLLLGLAGIGRWSAEYVLLRGLGRLAVLPGDDVGARNNLQRRFHRDDIADYESVAALASEWWPYGGLVYFHLLLDSLAQQVP